MPRTAERLPLPGNRRLRVERVRYCTSARVSQPDNHSIKRRPLGWRSKSATGKGCYHGNREGVRTTSKPENSAAPRSASSTPPPRGEKQVCFFVFLTLIGPRAPPTSTADSPRRASRSARRCAEECKPLTIKDNSGGLWVIMCHRCVIRLAGFCNQPPHFPKQKANSHASALSLARHSGKECRKRLSAQLECEEIGPVRLLPSLPCLKMLPSWLKLIVWQLYTLAKQRY